MDIMNLIQSQMGGEVMQQLGQQTGLDASQVQQALPSIMSSLMGGLANNAQSEGGAQAILGALGQHNGGILDNIMGAIGNQSHQEDGARIAGHVLGGNQANVAQAIGGAQGIDAGKIGQLISIAAPILMGALGRQNQQQGGFDLGGLAGVLMGGAQQSQQQSGFGGGIGGMIGDMIDQNNDGNVVDDVMGMLGGMFNKR